MDINLFTFMKIDKNTSDKDIAEEMINIGKANLMHDSMVYFMDLDMMTDDQKMNMSIGLCNSIYTRTQKEILDFYMKK